MYYEYDIKICSFLAKDRLVDQSGSLAKYRLSDQSGSLAKYCLTDQSGSLAKYSLADQLGSVKLGKVSPSRPIRKRSSRNLTSLIEAMVAAAG